MIAKMPAALKLVAPLPLRVDRRRTVRHPVRVGAAVRWARGDEFGLAFDALVAPGSVAHIARLAAPRPPGG